MNRKDVLVRELIKELNVNDPVEVEIISDVLSKMDGYQVEAVYYFLFPELTGASAEVEELVKEFKEKGKKNIKAERKGNDVDIEVL